VAARGILLLAEINNRLVLQVGVNLSLIGENLSRPGNGLAYLSRFMIAGDIEKGNLVELLGDHLISPNPRELVSAVYYRNTALSARIQVFLDFFKDRWRNL